MIELVVFDDKAIKESCKVKEKFGLLAQYLFPNKNFEIFNDFRKNFAKLLMKKGNGREAEVILNVFKFCNEVRNNKQLFDDINLMKNFNEDFDKYILKKQNLYMKYLGKIDEDTLKELEDEIHYCSRFIASLIKYNVSGFENFFALVGKSICSEPNQYSTESLIAAFAYSYLETDEFEELSSKLSNELNIKIPQIVNQNITVYYPNTDIDLISNQHAVVDNIEFPDCIETSIRQFFNFTQPVDKEQLKEFWKDSPKREEILNFFIKKQGINKSNSGTFEIRSAWAPIISKVPGLVYKKKTSEDLPYFDVELKAGWINYLKAISYLKHDEESWNELCSIDGSKPHHEQLTEIFKRLAGENLVNCEWTEDCGIRDMEDGSFDNLGIIKATFKDIPESVNFAMIYGHGYVQWTYRD